MARPPSLVSVRDQLDRELNQSIDLRDRAIRLRGPGSRQLPTKLSDQVVALAFMGMVDAWETFLEESLCRYMAGAISAHATRPTLSLGMLRSTIPAARNELYRITNSSSRGFVMLSYSRDILGASTRVFSAHDPYAFLGGAPHVLAVPPGRDAWRQGLLGDAMKIRHRLAHTTHKTKSDFKAMLVRYGVPSVQGVNPAALLQSPPLRAVFPHIALQSTVFDQFAAYYRDCAHRIVP